MCRVHDTVARAYEGYRFNVVFRTLYDYVTELSTATSMRRRIASTAVPYRPSAALRRPPVHILSMLIHDFQPITVYTTDEVMPHLPASA